MKRETKRYRTLAQRIRARKCMECGEPMGDLPFITHAKCRESMMERNRWIPRAVRKAITSTPEYYPAKINSRHALFNLLFAGVMFAGAEILLRAGNIAGLIGLFFGLWGVNGFIDDLTRHRISGLPSLIRLVVEGE